MLLASAASWTPVRWSSADPAALRHLEGTPFNCVLAEPEAWSADWVRSARSRGLTLLGVIRPGADISRAKALQFDGLALEGDFTPEALASLKDAAALLIHLPTRASLRLDAKPVLGTPQGVWPGIQQEENGEAKAAPSGAPWIHTNGGFLRFLRAAAPDTPVWLANTPPKGQIVTPERYMQAIADAAITGARWVVALDEDLRNRLYGGDAAAEQQWRKITEFAAWYESHPEWRSMRPYSQLALIQDADSGALYSGGVLDMISIRHTPVQPVPASRMSAESLASSRMAVSVDPASLTDAQKEALTALRRRGGSTLTGPSTWKFPAIRPDRITLSEEEVHTLDEIWKDVNNMTGRRNLGVRLFNVSSMLSSFLHEPEGDTVVLHLVNYSGYPVENVTVHLLGQFHDATLLSPGQKSRRYETYEIEEGTGVDIDQVGTAATLVLKKAAK